MSSLQIQSQMQFDQQIQFLQNQFDNNPYLSYKQRYTNLKALQKSYFQHKEELIQAIKQDINKPEIQTHITETSQIDHEFNYFLHNLKHLMQPIKYNKNMANIFYKKLQLQPVPYGISLLIVPFNYPANLSLIPLIGLIASGNYVLIKFSRSTPKFQQVVSKIVQQANLTNIIQIIQSQQEFNPDNYNQFNLIMFTGSTRVGKIIQQKASQSLTKCILECGGANPFIIDNNLTQKQLSKAIDDLLELKVTNAGQTCISSNYICCIGSQTKQLCLNMIKEKFSILNNNWNDMMPVVNSQKVQTIQQLKQTHKILLQFGKEENNLLQNFYFFEAQLNDQDILQEQFAPVLFVLEFQTFEQWIQWHKNNYQNNIKPLAAYLQSYNKQHQQQFIQQIDAGSNIINSGIMYLSSSLPFGGVGTSGQGTYHGERSFQEFSHFKPVVQSRCNLLDSTVGKIARFPYNIKLSDKMLTISLHNIQCKYIWQILLVLILIYSITISILYFKQ